MRADIDKLKKDHENLDEERLKFKEKADKFDDMETYYKKFVDQMIAEVKKCQSQHLELE